jgi:L-seryl-tRNA(Ser) seleniumtransferase
LATEAYRCLVALPVFKTGEVEYLGLAGSIPVRLRRIRQESADGEDATVTSTDPRRLVPRTDAILADPRLHAAGLRLGAGLVRDAVRAAQQRVRDGELDPGAVGEAALAALPATATSLRPVLNATGVVLHTNLGRARLSEAAIQALSAAAGYVDVEYDVESGARAQRGRGTLAALRAAVPAAEDCLVVNNGAAALVLATTALTTSTRATGRELVISRGEMVEIGDGFRLPDLIESTGARLREVGTTNRVTRADYQAAIGPDTAAVLKVHPSNFRVEGFTSAVAVSELADLGVPLIVDVGSGLLRADPLLPDEPDVMSTLAAGAHLITCSGDKLLGGPQAGLVFGDRELVNRLRRHPLARALRVDKLILAALEATLAGPPTPTDAYLHADADRLRGRCEQLRVGLAGIDAAVVESAGAVGGGGAPGLVLPGWALALPAGYADALRRGSPVVVGRVERDRCLLDLRCIDPADDGELLRAVRAVTAR